jgi:hypothetical protein
MADLIYSTYPEASLEFLENSLKEAEEIIPLMVQNYQNMRVIVKLLEAEDQKTEYDSGAKQGLSRLIIEKYRRSISHLLDVRKFQSEYLPLYMVKELQVSLRKLYTDMATVNEDMQKPKSHYTLWGNNVAQATFSQVSMARYYCSILSSQIAMYNPENEY